jgi:hypothetical protein
MAWHPRLVVRTGKGGRVSSPTSSLGYGFIGGIAAVAAVALIAAATHGKPLMIVGLVIPAVFLRDAWAWFAATPEEREAFRAVIAQAAAWGGGQPPDQLVIAVGNPLTLVVGLVWLAASLYLLGKTYPVELLYLFSAMIAACFTLAVLIDVIRQRLARRRAGKS